MRKLALEQRPQFHDRDVLLAVLLKPQPPAGMTIGEMRLAIKIADRIESAKDSVLLEEAEWRFLLDQYRRFPFAVVHKDLVALDEALAAATDA